MTECTQVVDIPYNITLFICVGIVKLNTDNLILNDLPWTQMIPVLLVIAPKYGYQTFFVDCEGYPFLLWDASLQ